MSVPMHIKRPSPRHERHLVPLLLITCLMLFCTNLEGSSHRFSPSRKTRCSETSTPELLALLSFTTVFSISAATWATEETAAPFTPSYNQERGTKKQIKFQFIGLQTKDQDLGIKKEFNVSRYGVDKKEFTWGLLLHVHHLFPVLRITSQAALLS